MDAATVNYGFQCYPENLKNVIKQVKSFKCNDVSIAWRNLKFEVSEFCKFGQNKKIILNRLNGHFNSGTLNGLLGPSGSVCLFINLYIFLRVKKQKIIFLIIK